MRLFTTLFAFATISRTLVNANNETSAILAQPPCVLQCITTDLATLIVTPDTHCTNKTLVHNLIKCVRASCTVKQGLMAKRVFAEVCHLPHRDKSQFLLAVTIATGILVALSFVLRCLTRLPPMRVALGWDDLFCTLAVIALITALYPVVRLTQDGFGRDAWTLSFDQITTVFWLLYICGILYHFIIGVTKLSILFFCRRVFYDVYSFRVVNNIVLAVCAALTLAFVFGQIFQCLPVSYLWTGWTKEEQPVQCVSAEALLWASAITSMLLDLSIIGSTVPYVLGLNLSFKRKLQVSFMFCVGFFLTIVSAIRTHSLIAYPKSRNPTWDKMPTVYWSLIEVNVGIMCACMPAIQLYFRWLWPRVFGDGKQTQYNNIVASSPKPGAVVLLEDKDLQESTATASTDRTRVNSIFDLRKYGFVETLSDNESIEDPSPKSSPKPSQRSRSSPNIS